jgi:hypothetical protein
MIRAINKTDNEDWGWAKEDRKNACVIEYSLAVHAWHSPMSDRRV